MKTRLVAAILALTAVFTPGKDAAFAQTDGAWKLAAVSVEGSQRFPESEIIAASGLKSAQAVTQADLEAANGRLGRTGAFAKVGYQYAVKAGAVTVTYQVTDTRRLPPARFANFVWMPEDQLLAELRSRVPLFRGDVSPAGEMMESIDRALEAILKERGIVATADSLPLQERLGAPVTAMIFTVHGPSLPVREVVFTGNSAVSSTQLAQVVQPLLGKDYDQVFATGFVRNVASPLYQALGYLRASFEVPQTELADRNSGAGPLKLTVAVKEGLQYNLGRISWSGNSGFSADELGARVTLPPNRPANAVELGRDLTEVEKLYGTRGYLAAHVQSEAAFDDSSRTVNYTLLVSQGAQYHMGQLVITGVDENVAARLVRDSELHPGDPYNAAYWSDFLKKNSRDLPPNPHGWKSQNKVTMHEDSKTVDITIALSSAHP